MKVKTDTIKMISGLLLLAFWGILIGLLIWYPIGGRDLTTRQLWGWAALEWIIYTIGISFAKAASSSETNNLAAEDAATPNEVR